MRELEAELDVDADARSAWLDGGTKLVCNAVGIWAAFKFEGLLLMCVRASSIPFHSTLQGRTEQYSTVRSVRYGPVRYGTVRYGTGRDGTGRYGTVHRSRRMSHLDE